MLPFRGLSRLSIIAIFILLTLLLLLASPFSGHAGKQSRRLISQVVEKVQKGEIGPLRMGSPAVSEEDQAMREWEYKRAVLYEGTGARIHTFLEKAKSGQPFTVSVIGGSVSKGRGLIEPKVLSRRQDVPAAEPTIPPAEPLGDGGQPLSTPEDHEHEENLSPNPSNPIHAAPLGASTLYSPENLHVLIFDWLNATYPHPENRLINGAQGGVGSGYWSWCYKEHIDVNSDLVLLELGINDLVEMEVLGSYEHLIRGALELPNRPAILNVETFTTLFPTLLSSSSLHLDVAAFYDIPVLSIRDVLLPRLMADPDTQMPRWFRTGDDVHLGDQKVKEWGGVPVDLMHISALGHALAAGLVIRYLTEQINHIKPASSFGAFGRLSPGSLRKEALRVTDLPSAALTMPFDPHTGLIHHDPTCRSMNSGRYHPEADKPNGETHRGILAAEGSKGWEPWAWGEKLYLVAREPGSTLSIPFRIPSPALTPHATVDIEDDDIAIGDAHVTDQSKLGFEPLPLAMRPNAPYNVQPMGVKGVSVEQVGRKRQYPSTGEGLNGRVLIGYQRSATLGLGSVWCWVDEDKEQGRQVDGWWEIRERNPGMVEEITSGLSEGLHTLHCELLEHTLDPTGRTEFRIFSVMHD